jgi:hypothetical protein
MKNLFFLLKVLFTVLYTAVFNCFLTTNFDVNIITLTFFSLLFSMFFYNILSLEIKFINDLKELF